MKRHRVLVVDDSAFARRVMRDVLSADERLEVVGYARDGLEALEKVTELSPDVLTLDLVMPDLDGVGVLDALRQLPSSPRVVVVTTSTADSPLAVAALTAGAFDVVHKPTALATDRLYELRGELVEKVVAAGAARRLEVPPPSAPTPPSEPRVPPMRPVQPRSTRRRIVVIGASTGGPRAIALLLRELPADLPVPLAVVVHMPPGYTEAFAERLDGDCALSIAEARDGTSVGPGSVTIARAGIHLRVGSLREGASLMLDAAPPHIHRPAVDVLFTSAAQAFGPDVLGVVLTGMGSDGVEGARAIHAAGGEVIVEDASSCVVYGMPRAVVEAGLADAIVPLDRMANAILSRL